MRRPPPTWETPYEQTSAARRPESFGLTFPTVEVTSWAPSAPIDFADSIDRYTRWGADLATVVHNDSLYRVAATGAPYRVTQLSDGSIEVGAERDLDVAVAEARFRLSETLPLEAVSALAERIPSVGKQLSKMPGYRPPMNGAVLESLVASICAQQVNLTWAATTRGRLVARFGVQHALDGVTVWAFPRPEILASADRSEIREMQFTNRKSEYIIEAARAVSSNELDDIDRDEDERVIERITAIRGLGRWTAEWFLSRTLARPDAIAAGDLGVRKAISRFVVGSAENLPETEIRRITASWGEGGNWGTHLLLEKLAASG